MRFILLCVLAVTSTCFSLPSTNFLQEKITINKVQNFIEELLSKLSPQTNPNRKPTITLAEVQKMLQEQGTSLRPEVIEKVLKTLKCANQFNVQHNHILTIIDYSLPSSEKRLWVYDLNDRKLLYQTYVSHGLKSGALLSTFFSNKFNSKSSSIGVYKTDKTYYGRHGLSLQLTGLEYGFNDNAQNRAVVMHGGWYVEEDFISKYGRAGRSWGCPALPDKVTSEIINAIKDDALFVVYYPSDAWFGKSKFLNCDNLSPSRYSGKIDQEMKPTDDLERRGEVLFARVSAKNHEEPIVTVSAVDYERIFHMKPPLERMLRRQINDMEYIALSNLEFESLAVSNNKDDLNSIYFVIPVIKMVRGYYATEMHFVDLGKIKELRLTPGSKSYAVDFELKPSIQLRTSNQFIRWLGL